MTSLVSSLSRRAGLSFDAGLREFRMLGSRRWKTRNIESTQQDRAASDTVMDRQAYFKDWSHEKLIERVTELENKLKARDQRSTSQRSMKVYKKRPASERQFDPSKYSTRLVAFKLAYLGKNYNGFEHHANNNTPRPTIEQELWNALNRARLIFPKVGNPSDPGEVNWDGCDYSKCGRTDKGVSAFGQVIAIRVRSNRPLPKRRLSNTPSATGDEVSENSHNKLPGKDVIETTLATLSEPEDECPNVQDLSIGDEEVIEAEAFDPIADEIPYASLLNKMLPPEIRILAWCPAPPIDFSARFSCRERQYKYFFTQPAFVPSPSSLEDSSANGAVKDAVKDGWLDIEAMQEAAKRFEGLHDFRNFCKVDPGKQISNFDRRIYSASVEVIDDATGVPGFFNETSFASEKHCSADGTPKYPKVYSFNLNGSAFLWHQVRHMVAILFLVGQGLESPSLVSELLDVQENPRRPIYEMAVDYPLVLWDCIFPREDDPERKDSLQWHYVGDGPRSGDMKYGTGGLIEDLWKVYRQKKIDEVLAGSLLDIVSRQGQDTDTLTNVPRRGGPSKKVFDGGDVPRLHGIYLPVMKKPLMDSVSVINDKFAAKLGFEGAEDMKKQGYKRPSRREASPLHFTDHQK